MLHDLLYHQQKFACGPTAEERLTQLSGSGTAGCLLKPLASGSTTGVVLTNYSGLPPNPASTHLLAPGSGQLTAPSGMRRLELYRLQEEALKQWEKKKDEQEQGQEAPSGEGEGKAAKPVESPKPRTRGAKRRPVPDTPPAIIPWRVPVVDQPSIYEQLASLPDVPEYIRVAIQNRVIISFEAEKLKRARHARRRRAAAFLLLAA